MLRYEYDDVIKLALSFAVCFKIAILVRVQCAAVDPADVSKIAKTVGRALKVYGTPAFTEMINNCMSQDLSWKVYI